MGPLRRIAALAALAVVLGGLSGCGPRAADVAGVWEGTWTADNAAAGNGTFRAEIQQNGNRVSGRIHLSLAGVPEARVDGGVEGDRVRWGVVREGLRALTFEGHVRGDRAEGTYSMITTRVGRWEARRVARTAP